VHIECGSSLSLAAAGWLSEQKCCWIMSVVVIMFSGDNRINCSKGIFCANVESECYCITM
jgi:hypothetical protein